MNQYMKEISDELIINDYNSDDTVDLYEDFTNHIGLLNIEKYLIEKYIDINEKILDVGCGCGRTTFDTYNLGYHNIVGVDMCENMIIRARQLEEQKSIDILFLNEKVENIRNSKFDCVTFWFNGLMVVYGEQNRNRIVDHIYDLLNVNGLFIFTAPMTLEDYDENTEKERFLYKGQSLEFEQGDRIYDKKYYIHFSSDEEIMRMCSKFELLETNVCDRVCPQSGHGYNLSYKSKYWVFRR